jgi:hypothetical protein
MQNGTKSSVHTHILLGVDGVRVNHLLSHFTYNVHLPSITTLAVPCLNKITKQKTGMQQHKDRERERESLQIVVIFGSGLNHS